MDGNYQIRTYPGPELNPANSLDTIWQVHCRFQDLTYHLYCIRLCFSISMDHISLKIQVVAGVIPPCYDQNPLMDSPRCETHGKNKENGGDKSQLLELRVPQSCTKDFD